MMAKNEIKMLLLGAGESGKVGTVMFGPHNLIQRVAVNCTQADEVDSSRWIQ